MTRSPCGVYSAKMDAADPKKVEKLQRWSKKKNLEFVKISSVTGKGLDELKHAGAFQAERGFPSTLA